MLKQLARFNISALLVLTLLPGLVALLFTAYTSYQHQRAAADQDLLGRVRTVSQLMDQRLLSVQQHLSLIAATSDEIDRGDLAAFHRKLQLALPSMPEANVLLLFAPSGQMLLNTEQPWGTALPHSSSAQRLQSVLRTAQPQISDIFRGVVSKKYLIAVNVPVVRGGKVRYVLTAGIFCEHLNQLLNLQIFPEGWNAVIYDRTGTIAGRKLNAEQSIGKKVAPTVLSWLTGPPEHLGKGRTLEGKMSVAAMLRSAHTGYSVTASVPEDLLIAPVFRSLAINGLAIGGSLLLGSFFAWRFATSMRASLRELEQAVHAVATGKPRVHRLNDLGTTELQQLSRSFNDMTESLETAHQTRDAYQRQLEFSATHDPLTGLANRALVSDRIEHAVNQAVRSNNFAAVLLLDLDQFKLINDTLSHSRGDELLVEIGHRLQNSVRQGDTVGRLGGDEFLIVIENLETVKDAVSRSVSLLQAIAEPIHIAGHTHTVSASMGIAIAPRDGQHHSELIMNADVAMYCAKESGRGKFQFFSPAMNARMQQRLELEAGLRQAIERREFVLYYQPRCSLETGRIVGAEALIRWRHPERGLVSPAQFIPVAEETGLIVQIGEWVLETACEAAQRWHQASGWSDLVVAVNVSARQFQLSDLAAKVDEKLRSTGMNPNLLELELTESAVMTNPEATLAVLHEVKSLGVRIALDDFGTGYSSLGYLKRFPIDCLKIDQSFVRDICIDPEDAAIAQMVITLGHCLRQKVVAEGVETEEQLDFLRTQGCDWIQGYYFSPPIPMGEFEALLRADRSLPII